MDSIINSTMSKQEMSHNNEEKEKHFDEEDEYIETPWNIIESYFKGQYLERLVRHQLESYNNFVSYQIMKTIEMFNPVHIKSEQDFDIKSGKYALELFVTFENFHIYRPQIHENNVITTNRFVALVMMPFVKHNCSFYILISMGSLVTFPLINIFFIYF